MSARFTLRCFSIHLYLHQKNKASYVGLILCSPAYLRDCIMNEAKACARGFILSAIGTNCLSQNQKLFVTFWPCLSADKVQKVKDCSIVSLLSSLHSSHLHKQLLENKFPQPNFVTATHVFLS